MQITQRNLAAAALLLWTGANASAGGLALAATNTPLALRSDAGTNAAAATEGWAKLSIRDLEKIRAGFETGLDLSIAIGIQRTVWVDDKMVSADAAVVSNPLSTGSDQLHAISALMNSGVLQNQLNNQKIQAYTVINAAVNAMSVLCTINLQTSIRNMAVISIRH